MKKSLQYLILLILSFNFSFAQTISTSGFSFSPDTLVVNIGDTITFSLGGYHNAVEVNQSTWLANATTTNGGFNIPLGSTSGYFVADSVQTFYYVCQPHVSMGMKGVIIANALPIYGCTDSTALNYNPLATIDDGSCITIIAPDSNMYLFSANGMSFSHDTLIVNVGDTIEFNLGINHNAVEVSQSTWLANDTTSNGGFNIAFGVVDLFIPLIAQTYYLVCQVHVSLGMKSVIIVNPIITQVPGCTDSTALNYNPLATIDDGTCTYSLVYENLFFSEWSEGSSYNKYFEIFNPTNDTISLANYAFARVSNSPTIMGVYEYWNDFDSGAVILPLDVFIVAHPSADSLILAQADMTFGSLSNGNDGMALVYGNEPASPMAPDGITYAIVDWIGDWNGDPGQGWNIGSVFAGTRNHTIIRKCNITNGDTSWVNSAANQWMVRPNNDWNNIGYHTVNTSVYDSLNFTICNGLSVIVGANTYDSTGVYTDILIAANGCDSIVVTDLTVLTSAASVVVNNLTICDGDSILVDSNYYNATGIYIDTLQNFAGCDSIITTHLTVQTPVHQSFTICDGDSVMVGSSVYHISGIYIDTLISSVTCDSIVNTEVIVYSQFNSVYGGIENTTVGGGSYYSGSQYLELNSYQNSELVSAVIYAADTVVETFEVRDINGNLLADTTYQIIPGGHRIFFNFPLVAGNTYQLGVDGNSNDLYRNNSGVNYPYNFGSLAEVSTSSAGGNYYYFFYDIEIQQTSTPTTYTICAGDSITVAGNTYTTSGLYTDSLLSSIGCDSLVYTELLVFPNATYTNMQTICSGETYLLNGTVYDSSGTYIDSLQTIYGCDSIVTTHLTVLSISAGTSVNNQTICMGDYIMVGTHTYFAAGTYYDTLTSANGCDSIITTNLTVQTANYTSINGGIPDTTNAPGSYSNYNGHLLLDVSATTLIKSATVYALDTNTITFELRDDNGWVMDDVTHTVYPGAQSLTFNFMLPVGADYQLGISGGTPNLYRSNAGSGNILAYPFNAGPVSITSSVAGDQYYYFYYDIEFMPFSTFNEEIICDGDSIIVGVNTYNTPGQYVDTLMANNSCDSVVITVLDFYQTPTLNVGSAPSPAEICLGDTILLEASPGFVSYAWTNGMTGQIIYDTPTTDTWYMVEAVDANGCVVKEDINVYVDSCITDVNEIRITEGLKVYPNPATDIVFVQLNLENSDYGYLEIINYLGQEIGTYLIQNAEDFSIDISHLRKGLYLCKLIDANNEEVTTKKLTIN